jgi:hypothetical protein
MLGRSVDITKKQHTHTHTHTESLIVALKETVLQVNADKTKYMVMSRDQNAGEVTV